MKRFVEIAWLTPIDVRLYNHLRNDMRFSEEHLKVFDSVTHHSGTADFHADNTGFDKKKFARLYGHVAEVVLTELIRLAADGYKQEINAKSSKS